MELHLTAVGCHLPYRITQCYLVVVVAPKRWRIQPDSRSPEIHLWCQCCHWNDADVLLPTLGMMGINFQPLRPHCHNVDSVTCDPTQLNTPCLNPNQTGRHLICLPRRDGRLSWPRWLVTYRDGLPAHRWSLVQVLTWQSTPGNRTRNLLITYPLP